MSKPVFRTGEQWLARRTDRLPVLLHRIWQVLFLSIFIDLIPPSNVATLFSRSVALTVAVALSAVAIPFLAQRRIHQHLASLRRMNKQSLAKGASRATLFIGSIAALFSASKLLFTANVEGIIALIILVVAVAAGLHSMRHAMRQNQEDRASLLANPKLQIQRWEEQLLVILILPLVCARAVSLLGIVTDGVTTYDRIALFVAGLVLLALLKPQQAFFRTLCERCKQPVPVVLASMGGCWRCDARLREQFHTKENKSIRRLPKLGKNQRQKK